MVNLRSGFCFILLFLWASQAHALVVDYNYVSNLNYAGLSSDVHDAVGQQSWMFTHASVGGNMMSGMNDLRSSDPSTYQLARVGASSNPANMPSTIAPGSIYDISRGNPGWSSKYSIFDNLVRNGWGDSVDFVMDKLCYIDQNANVNDYISMMEELDDLVSATLVWTTMPLTTATNGSAELRNEYNNALRAYAASNDILLFDIADLEAHDSAGNVYTYGVNGYQTLFSGWTNDGGHLNGDGRIWVADGWYALAASQVNLQGEVPEPGSLLLFGAGATLIACYRRKRKM